jgi:hypothetical protein
MSELNHRAWSDWEREEHTIERVNGDAVQGYTLCFDGGMCCGIPASDVVTPKVGDSLTLWGKGFGCSFRGQALNGTVLWYREQAEYETKRPEHDATLAAMPDVFQQRIAGYRERNPNFGWKFEGYELMACRDAVRIAEALKTPEAITAFYSLPWEEQKRAVPDLDEGHSGNSFGFACRMASLYLTHPELVPKFHGAMAVLVGSEEYGDWSSSEEARQERLAESAADQVG